MTAYATHWLSYDPEMGDLIPIPANSKKLDKSGFTGRHGRPVTEEDRQQWATLTGNVVLHLSPRVIGIDVDDYAWMEDGVGHEKNGFADQDALADAIGIPLPRTWVSTGREVTEDYHISGIRFYRVPEGFVPNMDRLAGNIELITHEHRYAVVWPSEVHDARGDRVYRWWQPGPVGEMIPADMPPALEDLTELPEAWRVHISSAANAPQSFGRVPDLRPEDVDMAYARAHCEAVLASVRAELEECVDLPEGELDSRGNSWEKAVSDAARNIWRMVWTPGSRVYGFPMQGLGLFLETIPEPMKADGLTYDARAKWASEEEPTHRDKGPLMVLTPVQRAALDFAAGVAPPEQKTAPVFATLANDARTMARDILKFTRRKARFSLDENAWWVYDEEAGLWRQSNVTTVQQARTLISELCDVMPEGDGTAAKGSSQYTAYKRFQMLAAPAQRGGLAAMVVDEATRDGIRTSQMDSQLDLFWAGGQCWNLRTGHIDPGTDPCTPHERAAAVAPEAGPFPRFQALLDATLPRKDHQELWWALMGDATTGLSGRVLGILYGATGRGKSALMTLVAEVLGSYAAPIPPELLTSQAAPHMTMDLKGVRFAFLDEGLSPNAKSSWERIKSLTSGAPQVGARKFRSSVKFTPSHTLFLTDNKQPAVADPALRSRTKALEVSGDVAAVDRAAARVFGTDQGKSWLREEGPAVLSELMRWAGEILRKGEAAVIVVPEDMERELDEIATQQDSVSAWLTDCCTVTKEDWSRASELYRHYADWAERNGYRERLNSQQFGYRLTMLGVENRRGGKNKIYRGLMLTDEY